MSNQAWLAACLLALAACAPDLSPPVWLVDQPRILAVVADAPEVSPGSASTFRALVAGPQGTLSGDALASASWALCTAPLPLTESGSVSQACLGQLASEGQGGTATLSTSSAGCSLFGPLGGPSGERPRDSDATGGYYEPVRFAFDGQLAFAEERLLCPLAQASFQTALQYRETYTANRNPGISGVSAATLDGAPIALEAVPAGATLQITLAWPAADNESFPVLEISTLSLATEVETMRVSWFATAGALAQAQSGPDASQAASEDRWSAPAQTGPVYLWAVLRDSRGGASWLPFQINVVEAR